MKVVRTVSVQQQITAIDALVNAVPELSKGRLKDAMSKGAVLLAGKPKKRLRRAQTNVQPGQQLELHYDDDLLQRSCPAAQLIEDQKQYSIWFKPAGMLSQGNEWGDHLSLLRAVEVHFEHKRQMYLVHRLDREASGLVLLAHTKNMAAAFSKLIAQHQIRKHYRICVKGQLAASLLQQAQIALPLDNKASTTCFTEHYVDELKQQSWLDIELISGRKHQIRRHFEAVGHPVIGDPQYGTGNKSAAGLMLQAVRLQFDCPLRKHAKDISLPLAWQLLPQTDQSSNS